MEAFEIFNAAAFLFLRNQTKDKENQEHSDLVAHEKGNDSLFHFTGGIYDEKEFF